VNRNSPRALGAAIAAAALLAPLVVVAVLASPADASGLRRHDITTYKREGWIGIEDDYPGNQVQPQLACEPGDYAVDGAWKVDAHDGDPRSLRVDASYGGDVDANVWHFSFTNDGPGRAQVKLFVTCLVDRTGDGADGHHHDLVVGSRTSQSLPGLPSGALELDTTAGCTSDQIPLAPGFEFTSGHGAVYRSYPTMPLTGWHWAFLVQGPADLRLHLRCLERRTTAPGAGGHVHEVDADFGPAYAGQHETLADGLNDRTVGARQSDEGLVGAFWIDDPFHVAYLGQDPRGQVRAYRFWNDGAGSAETYLGLYSLDKRTSRQLAP
jgi:hypothetical protein